MKRKRSAAGVLVASPNPLTEPKTEFESKELSYSCLNCGILPVSRFSKSKINQYDRQKITVITCNICTGQSVAKDENEKSDAKELRIKKEKAAIQTQKDILIARESDPSATYESNPLNTPIVNDAMKYFEGRSLPFKIHLGKVKGWRTIAKLAVRGEIVSRKVRVGSSNSSSVSSSSCSGGGDGDGGDGGGPRLDEKKIKTSIGLFQPGTHKVIKCLVSEAHHPSINICVSAVSRICESLGIHGYIEGSGSDKEESFLYKSYLKYIMMAVERETGKVQLSIVWNTVCEGNDDGNNYLTRLVDALSKENIHNVENTVMISSPENNGKNDGTLLFHSIWVNYNPSSRYSNAITCHDDDAWSLLYGKAHIKEKVRTDMRKPPALRFPPLVFRQANIDAFTNIVQNIRTWVKDFAEIQKLKNSTSLANGEIGEIGENGEKDSQRDDDNVDNKSDNKDSEIFDDALPIINCVELYAGVGTIGLNCLDLFSSLHCSDENPHNKICFDSTLSKMKKYSTRAVYESKGASFIASRGGLKGRDVVIVDPPRKGLDDDVIDALLAFYPETNQSRYQKRGVAGTEHGRVNNSRLIYVSCGFKAFKRDVARLLGEEYSFDENNDADNNDNGNYSNSGGSSAGHSTGNVGYKLKMSSGHENDHTRDLKNTNIRHWRLIYAEGHVLFPGSDHIETFAVFDRVT